METDKILTHVNALLAYFTITDTGDYRSIYNNIKRLRELSFTSEKSKETLLRLIYSNNVHTKIHAAESLSYTKSFPEKVIPVFQAFLDVAREQDKINEIEGWLRLCLSSIERYEEKAIIAENNVWEYLYTHNNLNLILYAIKALAKIAKVSTASWTILSLMCRHENETIRDFVCNLMKSDEFKSYMGQKNVGFSSN